jgi:16S rRNA (cytidine1402-2'-O)-methyltransferase
LTRRAEHASAARIASGRDANGGGDPSHRVPASKPGPAQSGGRPEARSPPEGEPIGTVCGGDAADWTPAHALAPGLHLVATPIGNLGDITLRALWVLRGADRILCEDTRVTARLLARFGIDKKLDTYHDHNAERVRPAVLDALRRGEKLALVSDAGTPLVSDPGFKLVRAALAEGLPVTAAPGPSAALTALILSGLPPDRFLFAGFLPPRSAARRRMLAQWAALDATLIFFEGPSRLAAALADMEEVLGPREAAIARELTKRHEEIRRDRLDALARHYRETGPPRGEMVIVVGPPEAAPVPSGEAIDRRLRALLARHSLRDAAALLAEETGLARRALYERALVLTRKEPGEEG